MSAMLWHASPQPGADLWTTVSPTCARLGPTALIVRYHWLCLAAAAIGLPARVSGQVSNIRCRCCVVTGCLHVSKHETRTPLAAAIA